MMTEIGNAASEQSKNGTAPEDLVVVGIGASAGGLKALEAFFDHVPDDLGMAFVVIVHLSPKHESQMAELLQQHTAMPVAQVHGRLRVAAGHVYVIPPGNDLVMADGHLDVSERSPQPRAPVDLFFRTLAETYGHNAVGVVLSGTGSDGSVGLGRIKEEGGLTMAQLPAEAEYDAMPRSAVATGHVDVVLPVHELAQSLQGFRRRLDGNTFPRDYDGLSQEDRAVLAKIIAHLRAQTGHDFTHYKHQTVLRRLTRRMHLTGTKDLKAYLEFIDSNTDEGQLLLKDLLLVVTSFFRDPEAFESLEERAIPKLFEQKAPGEAVRAWICGCATGEEAYSIAMLLFEEAERNADSTSPQIFASDIAENALQVAREGRYTASAVSEIPVERLNRFFEQETEGYRIKNEIRERIVFAMHNLLQDPPFSRLDLIACRNVLIYLDRSVHGRVFDLFHYALKPGGYLFLGSAESIDAPDLFRPLDTKLGLYERRPGASIIRPSLAVTATMPRRDPIVKPASSRPGKPLDVEALHRALLARFAPPSLIVDADNRVIHTLAGGEAYLEYAPGLPTQDILKIVREEFRLELRTALYRAFRKSEETRSRPITVDVQGELRRVELRVEPISEQGFAGDHAHVLFYAVEEPARKSTGAETSSNFDDEPVSGSDTIDRSSLEEAEITIGLLEDELDQVKQQLQSTTEEHDVAIEAMSASNEEMQSINEELRSTAEELETSKEELQSVNEELMALNEELNAKIVEVREVNSDLKNLMNATEIGTIFLDRDLLIKRYTPRVSDLFEITDADVGRPLAALTHRLGSDALPADAARVMQELAMIEREVSQAENGRWFLVRLRPYQTIDGNIDGVVITFVDITQKKRYDEQLEELVATLEDLLTAKAHQIKQLVSELTLSEQSERQRIAQMLHDDLQQLLYAFQMRIDALSRSLTQEQAERLAQANTLIDRAIHLTRSLTGELNPPVLDGEDITSTLEWLAIRMEHMHGLKVHFKPSGPLNLPAQWRSLIYQIVRELLFNVVKHAGVDKARIGLLRETTQIVITIEDEGSGFDTAALRGPPPEEGGFGLRSVRQRILILGGRFEVDATPGGGTRASLFVPLDDDAGERDRHLPVDAPEETERDTSHT